MLGHLTSEGRSSPEQSLPIQWKLRGTEPEIVESANSQVSTSLVPKIGMSTLTKFENKYRSLGFRKYLCSLLDSQGGYSGVFRIGVLRMGYKASTQQNS